MTKQKWYRWQELVTISERLGYTHYGEKGNHYVVVKNDYYVHIPMGEPKISRSFYEHVLKKLNGGQNVESKI